MTAKLLQPSLTGGELSPSLYGRVDIARYSTALKRCRNFIVLPEGGVENRCGFYYCGKQATVPADHRLIPFVYSTEISYVLFFGDGYIRFQAGGADVTPTTSAWSVLNTYALDEYVTSGGIVYRSRVAANSGNVPLSSPADWAADPGLQISAPYSAAQVDRIRFTQSADVLYLVHPDVPPQELSRVTTNSFKIAAFENKEGPFANINGNEAIKVAASGVQGTVDLEASEDIFTANAIGSLFYIETKNLGIIKPWTVGERGLAVGALRRSDGKTYMAVTIPGAGSWHEAGPRQPVHENGRRWDGGGDTRSNGVDTWSVGIEWEFVDTGFGVVKITAVAGPRDATGLVTKRLPAQVVGGVGAPASTWNLSGDGVTKTFALAGAGYGTFAVTIAGVGITPDPNYDPGAPGEDTGTPCVDVQSVVRMADGTLKRAGDVAVGDELLLFDHTTWEAATGVVTYSETRLVPFRWRVFTARESSLVCSDSAPIPFIGGGFRTPSRLMGCTIPTSRSVVVQGDVVCDVVCDLVRLPAGYVQMITVGDRCFWAAETPEGLSLEEVGLLDLGFILHHNAKRNTP